MAMVKTGAAASQNRKGGRKMDAGKEWSACWWRATPMVAVWWMGVVVQ